MEPTLHTHEQLKVYYGKILKGKKDLQTTTCCCSEDSIPREIRTVLREIDEEILERSSGCAYPFPVLLTGCTVLDLGCGSGRDAYIASRLVGETGRVIGIDMTEEQLEVATKHRESHTKKFGYVKPNVDFRQGYLEDLRSAGIPDNSIDVVISNCVINLSPDKASVFREIFRVLKPGGELYFSDIFACRRLPESLRNDPLLQSECLAGALYTEDFRRLMGKIGWPDYRIVAKTRVTLENPEVEAKVGMVEFYSRTIRAFKLADLEDICEDYGQTAVYRGTVPGLPHFFDLDDHHRFISGKAMLVCGNTASMLQHTRFSPHFTIGGDRAVHYGPFNCGPAPI